MSTLITTNIKHPSSSSNNLVLTSGGGVTGAGKILQVVQTLKTDTFTTTSTSAVDITGMSVTITPSSSSNKVLVTVNLAMGTDDANFVYARLLRGSTELAVADAASNRPRPLFMIYNTNEGTIETRSFTFLDSPSTTSATTYKMQLNCATAGNAYITRSHRDNDASTYDPRLPSTITAMEVAA